MVVVARMRAPIAAAPVVELAARLQMRGGEGMVSLASGECGGSVGSGVHCAASCTSSFSVLFSSLGLASSFSAVFGLATGECEWRLVEASFVMSLASNAAVEATRKRKATRIVMTIWCVARRLQPLRTCSNIH